ncbi:desulfoferrodoxin family protein [Desulfatitalea alkaliphila]|uniref:Twin-arginine translocation signal domain-containing protein n=1 Tax=Desulfatitalea alkaliphila TaxID=2929485 RepID=A0AA41R4N9_9BACT|nr:desulfoferrodoxin family protein [Desulfatitalea alkaliphila]MCJ8500870.1 twin-arginine translocation signal domain-containing protein [Desulfatitalea alkaliphila]
MEKKEHAPQGFSRRDFMKTAAGMVAAGLVLRAKPATANKSAVRIVAPDSAAAGEEIVIELHVTHSGNSFFHYTNWVALEINGEEAQRWEYSGRNRPEDENFTVTLRHTMRETIHVKAEANCNLHGSEGPAEATVTLS